MYHSIAEFLNHTRHRRHTKYSFVLQFLDASNFLYGSTQFATGRVFHLFTGQNLYQSFLLLSFLINYTKITFIFPGGPPDIIFLQYLYHITYPRITCICRYKIQATPFTAIQWQVIFFSNRNRLHEIMPDTVN